MEITCFSSIIMRSLIISEKPSSAAIFLQDMFDITYVIRKNKNISEGHMDLIVF